MQGPHSRDFRRARITAINTTMKCPDTFTERRSTQLHELEQNGYMKREWFAGALASVLLIFPLASNAQQEVKVWRIGWLGLDSSMQATRIVAFENGLRDLGYVEGKNISIERRWAEGRFDRLPSLASELVAARVDVIVTASPPGVRAARRGARTERLRQGNCRSEIVGCLGYGGNGVSVHYQKPQDLPGLAQGKPSSRDL
jgi:hypothetical protein